MPASRYRNLFDPEVQSDMDQVPVAPERPQIDVARAQTLARSNSNPDAQRLGNAMLAADERQQAQDARQAATDQRKADVEARRQQSEQERQAKAEQARSVRAAAAAGAETVTDIETGRRTVATHPDGSVKYETGPVGAPVIQPTAEAAASSIPGMGGFMSLTRPADQQTLGQTQEVAQTYRDDSGGMVTAPLPTKTDPKTGAISSTVKDPVTGRPTEVPLGTDQAIQAKVAKDAELEQRRQALALRDNAVKQTRLQFQPKWEPVKKEFDEAGKELNAFTDPEKVKFIRDPKTGKMAKRDPNTGLPSREYVDPNELAKWQNDQADIQARHDRAKAAHDKLEPFARNLNRNETELKDAKLKLVEEKIRHDSGLPDDDGGASTILATASGEVEKPAGQQAVDEHVFPMVYAPEVLDAAQAEDVQSLKPKLNVLEKPLVPTDSPDKAKVFADAFGGLVAAGKLTLGLSGDGYQFIQRDGANIGSVDQDKHGNTFVTMGENLNGTEDLRQSVAFGTTTGVPVYLHDTAGVPRDTVKEAQYVASIFDALKDPILAQDKAMGAARLNMLDATPAAIARKVSTGELSIQHGEAIMKEVYNSTLKADDPLSPETFGKWISGADQEVKDKYTAAAKAKDTAALNAIKNDYASEWYVANRGKPGVNFKTREIAAAALTGKLRTGEKASALGGGLVEAGGSMIGMLSAPGMLAGLTVMSGIAGGQDEAYDTALADTWSNYGRASKNTWRGWELSREKWFTGEGKAKLSAFEDAQRALGATIRAQDGYRGGIEDPEWKQEYKARVDAVTDAAFAMHSMNLEDGWEVTRDDLDPSKNPGLAKLVNGYAITGDRSLLDGYFKALMEDHGTRQAQGYLADLTMGRGKFMSALISGANAPPEEIGVEIASTILTAGIGKAVFGGAKTAKLMEAGAEAATSASRMTRFRLGALGIKNEFMEAGMVADTLATPASKLGKASNFIVKGAKVSGANAVSEGLEEAAMSPADRNANADTIIKDAAMGALAGFFMGPVMAGPSVLAQSSRQAYDQNQAAKTFADSYNTANRGAEGFTPVTVEQAKTAMALAPDDVRVKLTEASKAATTNLIAAVEAAKNSTDPVVLNALSRAQAVSLITHDALATDAAMRTEAVIAIQNTDPANKDFAMALAKVASGRTDLLTGVERSAVAGKQTQDGKPYFATVQKFTPEGEAVTVDVVTDAGRAEAMQNFPQVAALIQTTESQAIFDAAQSPTPPTNEQDPQGQQGTPPQDSQPAPADPNAPVSGGGGVTGTEIQPGAGQAATPAQAPVSAKASAIKAKGESAIARAKKRFPNLKAKLTVDESGPTGKSGGAYAYAGEVVINTGDLEAELAGYDESRHDERVDAIIDEEIKHVAQYEDARRKGKSVEEYGAELWNGFTDEQKAAALNTYQAGFEGMEDWQKGFEAVRMLIQQKTDGKVTELTKAFSKKMTKQMLDMLRAAVDFLKSAIEKGDISKGIQEAIAGIESILAEYSGQEGGTNDNVSPPAADTTTDTKQPEAPANQATAEKTSDTDLDTTSQKSTPQDAAEAENPPQPDPLQNERDARETIRKGMLAARKAYPQLVDSDLGLDLEDIVYDMEDALATVPAEQRKGMVDSAIAAWIEDNIAEKPAAKATGTTDQKARRKAWRQAAQDKLNATARAYINSGVPEAFYAVFQRGRIAPMPNILGLIRKRRDNGAKLTEKEIAIWQNESEWNGALKKSNYTGGGQNPLARAMIDLIMARQGEGQSPNTMADALKRIGTGKLKGMDSASDMWEQLAKELRAVTSGKDEDKAGFDPMDDPNYEPTDAEIAAWEAKQEAAAQKQDSQPHVTLADAYGYAVEAFAERSATTGEVVAIPPIAQKIGAVADFSDRILRSDMPDVRAAVNEEFRRNAAGKAIVEWQDSPDLSQTALGFLNFFRSNTPESLRETMEKLPIVDTGSALFSSPSEHLKSNFSETPNNYHYEPRTENRVDITNFVRLLEDAGRTKIELVDSPDLRPAIRRIEQAFGTTIRFFRSPGITGTGFVPRGKSGLVFINAETSHVSLVWTLAHELTHSIQNNPLAKPEQLRSLVNGGINSFERSLIHRHVLNHYNGKDFQNELEAFFMADAIAGESFSGLKRVEKSEDLTRSLADYFNGTPARLGNQALFSSPTQPGFSFDQTTDAGDKSQKGLDFTPSQAAPASPGRFRPKAMVEFAKPYRGPSGAKLEAYEWKHTLQETVDKRGEDTAVRVSNWEEAATNMQTGREIVHQFHVTTKEGKSYVVSLESALKILGYTSENGKAAGPVRNLASMLRTRAQLTMEAESLRPAVEESNAQYARYEKESIALERERMPAPVFTVENGTPIMRIGALEKWGTLAGTPESFAKRSEYDLRQLESEWRTEEAKARAGGRGDYNVTRKLSDIEARIAKMDRKIQAAAAAGSSNEVDPASTAPSLFDTLPAGPLAKFNENTSKAYAAAPEDSKARENIGKLSAKREGMTTHGKVQNVPQAMMDFGMSGSFGTKDQPGLFASPSNQRAFDFGFTGSLGTRDQGGFDFDAKPSAGPAKMPRRLPDTAFTRTIDRMGPDRGELRKFDKEAYEAKYDRISKEEQAKDAANDAKIDAWLATIPENKPISFEVGNPAEDFSGYNVVTKNASDPARPWRATWWRRYPRPEWTDAQEEEYEALFKKTRTGMVGVSDEEYRAVHARLNELADIQRLPGKTRMIPTGHQEFKTRREALDDAVSMTEGKPEPIIGALFASPSMGGQGSFDFGTTGSFDTKKQRGFDFSEKPTVNQSLTVQPDTEAPPATPQAESEASDIPSFFTQNANNWSLWDMDERVEQAQGVALLGETISETPNERGTTFTPEAAMYQLINSEDFVSSTNGMLMSRNRTNASPNALADAWVSMKRMQNLIAKSRAENPAMWDAYDARQTALQAAKEGDMLRYPHSSSDNPLGGPVKLLKKFKKNWRVLGSDGLEKLYRPETLRMLEPTRDTASQIPRAAKPGELADFGEVLPGARKNQQRSIATDISDEDLANQPLSKIWPKGEVDSIEDLDMASIAHTLRDEVPAKPRQGYKVARWVQQVKMVRELMRHAEEMGPEALLLRMTMNGTDLTNLGHKIRLLRQLPREQWSRIGKVRDFPDSYRYDRETKENVKSPYASAMVDDRSLTADSIDALTPKVQEKLGTVQKPQTMKFEVRGTDIKGYGINKKGDPLYRRLITFPTTKEAFDYIKSHYDSLSSAWEAVKDSDNVKEADVRGKINRPRAGKDHLQGRDATPEMFTDALGFRGVEFGNWVSQGGSVKDRQGMLNLAFEALHDLADIMGIPPKAISLNGTLGLAFGSRGSGSASAHYEPDTLVINLTKTKGAGKLAHEWFHALDNYFQRQRPGKSSVPHGGNYITYQPEAYYQNVRSNHRISAFEFNRLQALNRARLFNPDEWKRIEGVRPQVEERFAELVKALNASPMNRRAQLIDKGKSDGYWSRVIERAARSFENYTIAKMQQHGYHNDYLANVVSPDSFVRDINRYPYLLDDEIAPIVEAFDNLFSTIQTKETDKGTALFSSPSPVTSEQLGTALLDKIGEEALRVEQPKAKYEDKRQQLFDFAQSVIEGDPESGQNSGNDAASGDVAGERMLLGRLGDASIIRQRLARDIQTDLQVRFIGDTIGTPQDLAVKAQALRNPRFETFYVLAAKQRTARAKNGAGFQILDAMAITSRVPTSAAVFADGKNMEEGLKDHLAFLQGAKATHYFLLHNHPSGDPSPSSADLRATVLYAKEMEKHGIKLVHHIVINHEQFSHIDASGSIGGERIPSSSLREIGTEYDPYAWPSKFIDGVKDIGMDGYGPDQIASIARDIEADRANPDHVLGFIVNSRGRIVATFTGTQDQVFTIGKETLVDYTRDQGGARLMLHAKAADRLAAERMINSFHGLNVRKLLTDIVVDFKTADGRTHYVSGVESGLFIPPPPFYGEESKSVGMRVQEGEQPDLFTAAKAPDATQKLGQVKVGTMNALGAYRTLTAKRDAGKALTGEEEEKLLQAEQALGQKLAFDMDQVKGAVPPITQSADARSLAMMNRKGFTREDEVIRKQIVARLKKAGADEDLIHDITVGKFLDMPAAPAPTTPAAVFGQNRQAAQDEMSRAGEIDRSGQISLLSSPASDNSAVAQALARMPAKYREVFAAVTAGKTPVQVAKQFGVTEKAVFNITNQVRARIAIAAKAEQGTLKPKMQGDQFERGRPDLAEGGQPPFVAVDQIRNEMAPTPVVGMEENHAVARRRLAANYEGEFTRLENMATAGILPTAEDIAIAKQIFKRETLSGGLEDPARRAKVALFQVAYRDDFGTEQGRALQMRRDEAMPPAERNALHLAELLYEPSPDVQARMKAAKGDKATQDAILKQWMDKIDDFHAEMKADGYDIKASMAKFQKEKAARESQEEAVRQQHDRFANAYQSDVDALQQQLAKATAAAEAAEAVGLASAEQIATMKAEAEAMATKLKKTRQELSKIRSLEPGLVLRTALLDLTEAEKAAMESVINGGTYDNALIIGNLTEKQFDKLYSDFSNTMVKAQREAAAMAKQKMLEAPPVLMSSAMEAEINRSLGIVPLSELKARKAPISPEQVKQKPKKPKAKPAEPLVFTPEQQAAIDAAFERFKNADPATWNTLFETEAKNLTPLIGQVAFEEFKGKALQPWRDRWQTEMDGIANPTGRISFEEWIANPSTKETAKRERELFPQPINETTGTFDTTAPNREGSLFPQPINPETGTWSETRPFTGQGELLREEINETTGTFDVSDPRPMAHLANEWARRNGTWINKLTEWYKIAILSGPQTMLINASGGLFVAHETLTKRAVEATWNDLMGLFGAGDVRSATLSEFLPMMKNVRAAMKLAATQALKSWTLQSPVFDAYALAKPIQQEFVGTGAEYAPPALETRSPAQFMADPKAKDINKVLNWFLRVITFRELTMVDDFWKSMFGQLDAAALAHRIAAKEESLSGPAYTARVAELMKPGSLAWQRTISRAKRATFQDSLAYGKFTAEDQKRNPAHKEGLPMTWSQALKKSETESAWTFLDAIAVKAMEARKTPFLGPLLHMFVLPFIVTPKNIMQRGLEVTPLGLVVDIIDGMRSLKRRVSSGQITKEESNRIAGELFNKTRFIQTLTNQSLGLMIYLALEGLADGDDDDEAGRPWITGTLPFSTTKKGERDNANAVMPPQSIRLGNTIIPYGRIEPLATAISALVDMAVSSKRNGDSFNGQVLTDTLIGFKEQFKDKLFLKGLGDILRVIENPERGADRLAAGWITGFVPNLIRQPIRETDSVVRDKNPMADAGFIEAVGKRVGFEIVPSMAPARFDVWGNPIPANRGDLLAGSKAIDNTFRILDPLNVRFGGEVKPIDAWIFQYNHAQPDSSLRIGIETPSDQITITLPGESRPRRIALTPAEHAQAIKNVGTAALEMLTSMDDWDWRTATGPDAADKAKLITDTFTKLKAEETKRIKSEKLAEIP